MTNHYTQPSAPLQNIQPVKNTEPIYLTNGDTIRASHTGILPNLPSISSTNKTAQICPANNNISLISVGKLCDDNCEARFNKNKCTIYKEDQVILTALRCHRTGIHVINLNEPKQLSNASVANRQHKVVNIHDFIDLDHIKFLHAALGGPPLARSNEQSKLDFFHHGQVYPSTLSINYQNQTTLSLDI